jgi:hypothetical protein
VYQRDHSCRGLPSQARVTHINIIHPTHVQGYVGHPVTYKGGGVSGLYNRGGKGKMKIYFFKLFFSLFKTLSLLRG